MTNAASITRSLRTAGFTVLPSGTARKYEGISVARGLDGVTIVRLDFDIDQHAQESAVEVTETLTGLGYTVRQSDHILFVTRDEAA